MDMQITRSNLGSILSKYPDLPETEKQAIQAQLTQAAEKDADFWKVVIDHLKEDPMLDTSDTIAVMTSVCTTGDMTAISDRYYSV